MKFWEKTNVSDLTIVMIFIMGIATGFNIGSAIYRWTK